MGGGKLAKNQAGQGEGGTFIQSQVQTGGQLVSTRPLMAWEGFMGQWNIRVHFPRAVLGWWVGMLSEWSRKREEGQFLWSVMYLKPQEAWRCPHKSRRPSTQHIHEEQG